MEIEAGLLELYRDPSLDEKPKLLEERGGAFYSEAAAALVASLHAGTGDVQVVNVRNAGAIPNLPDDDIVEIPRADRSRRRAPGADGPARAGDARHRPAREGVRAPRDPGRDDRRPDAWLSRRCIANPLVGDYAAAAPLLDALLEANRPSSRASPRPEGWEPAGTGR